MRPADEDTLVSVLLREVQRTVAVDDKARAKLDRRLRRELRRDFKFFTELIVHRANCNSLVEGGAYSEGSCRRRLSVPSTSSGSFNKRLS